MVDHEDTNNLCHCEANNVKRMQLTPKVLEAIFQAFMKFGQAVVDAMFVQKISNFW
jgi:hypothetical protein